MTSPQTPPPATLPTPLRRSRPLHSPRHAAASDLRPVALALGGPLALATVVSAGAPGWTTYTVRPGDTVSALAAAHSTTVAAVARTNGLPNASRLRIGQVLRFAAARPVPAAAPRAHPAAKPVAPRTRVVVVRVPVRRGDTLSGLSRRWKASVGYLATLNHLQAPYRIYVGQALVIRAPKVVRIAPPAAPRRVVTTVRYTVRAGDCLATIAARQHTTTAALAALNTLHPPYLILIGQVLVVRQTVRVAATTARTTTRSVASRTFAGRTYSEAVVRAAEAARARLRATQQPTRAQLQRLITATAQRYGVPPALALAIAMQESGWDQRQVSVAGAIGTMQVMPSTGVWMSDLVGRRLDLFRAQDNVTAGVVLLRWLRDHTTRDSDAIAAYYEGLGNVQQHGWFPDTHSYVASVTALQKRYS